MEMGGCLDLSLKQRLLLKRAHKSGAAGSIPTGRQQQQHASHGHHHQEQQQQKQQHRKQQEEQELAGSANAAAGRKPWSTATAAARAVLTSSSEPRSGAAPGHEPCRASAFGDSGGVTPKLTPPARGRVVTTAPPRWKGLGPAATSAAAVLLREVDEVGAGDCGLRRWPWLAEERRDAEGRPPGRELKKE